MSNPLTEHFRKTEIFIPLPSKGKYYDTPVTMNVDNEVGIKSMRVKDEIEMKGADALFSGEALYHLIESCVPDIKNAREMPVYDADPVLLGIKYASYGSSVDLSVTCPKCETENSFSADLTTLIGKIQPKEDEDNTIDIDGSIITVRPYTLESSVKKRASDTRHAMLIKSLEDPDIDEDTQKEIYMNTIKESSDMLTDIVSASIVSVKIDEESEEITDKAIIREWVGEMNRKTYNKVQEKINSLSSINFDKNMDGVCQECSHEFSTDIAVNPFSFFSESF